MRPHERDHLRIEAQNVCQKSRLLLGLIGHQTPHLKPEAELILSRVETLEAARSSLTLKGSPSSFRRQVKTIDEQVAAIGLRSKNSMKEANA